MEPGSGLAAAARVAPGVIAKYVQRHDAAEAAAKGER